MAVISFRHLLPRSPIRMSTIDVVRTYLEMRAPEALRPAAAPLDLAAALRVERLVTSDVAEYRDLYREVGARYHWRDRLEWSDARLAAYLAQPDVAVWVLTVRGERAGYFELRAEPRGSQSGGTDAVGADGGASGSEVELVYFGLVGRYIGRGLGKYLLTRAVEEAWRTPGARRVWLHTCTLDDRAALPNYLARGFEKVREERYVAEV